MLCYVADMARGSPARIRKERGIHSSLRRVEQKDLFVRFVFAQPNQAGKQETQVVDGLESMNE